MSFRSYCRWTMFAGYCLAASSGLVATAAAPAERVAFSQILEDGEYDERSLRLEEKRAYLRRRANTKQPSEGALIAKLVPGGRAEELGIEANDLLYKQGEDVIWTAEPDFDRQAEERVLEFYDQSADRMRVYRIEGPQIGVYLADYWNPALRYLRSADLLGKWDDHVLNACLALETDPQFAEAALSRALRDGCRLESIVAEVGIVVSLGRNLPERASELLDLLNWDDDATAATLNPVVSFRAALANNRLDVAARIVKFSPLTFRFDADVFTYLQALDQESAADSVTPAKIPSEAVESLYRDDLIPHLSGQTWYSVRELVPALKRGEKYSRKIEAGHFHSYLFGVDYPVNDIEYRANFTLKPTETRGSEWGKEIVIGLYRDDVVDPEVAGNRTNSILGIHVAEIPGDLDGRARIQLDVFDNSIEFPYPDRTIRLDGQQEIDVRILRVDDVYEVQLNGNRVLLLTIAEDCSLLAGVQIVGVSHTLNRIEFAEWIPKSE